MASQFPQQNPPSSPPPSSGSSFVKVLLIILIVVLILCGGLCGGCIYVGRQAAQKVAELATIGQDIQNAAGPANNSIRNSEAVKEKFGEELELSPALPDLPKITDFKDRSNVPFIVTIKGSKGEGIAHCRAGEDSGRWKILEIKVTGPDGAVIDVPISTEETPPELQFNVPDGEQK